jgi:hypothetical protein
VGYEYSRDERGQAPSDQISEVRLDKVRRDMHPSDKNADGVRPLPHSELRLSRRGYAADLDSDHRR